MIHGYTSVDWWPMAAAWSSRNAAWWAVAVGSAAVIVYIGQAIALLKTLTKQAEATRAAEAAANAARRSAELSEQALELAQKTAKIQLRAYVDVSFCDTLYVIAGSKPLVRLQVKNTGQTPARDVMVEFSSGIRPYPDPGELNY